MMRVEDYLEYGATAVVGTEAMIALSTAISLKRIADAICGDEKNTGIHRMLFDIADRMGQ